jgi:hypothetical protein
MKNAILTLSFLFATSAPLTGAHAKSIRTEKLSSATVWLLNGVLNGRWANLPEMQKCLNDFRALEADVTSGSHIPPKGEAEEVSTYKILAERYVKGGKEVYLLTIESGEGAYDCKLARIK